MISRDELKAIPLFASLSDGELDELARTSADMHLNAGEYAAHEGELPALLVVVSGSFELIKLVDGIGRRIATRKSGQTFGEVSIVFGLQLQADCRALEPSRMIRIEPVNYYAAAGASPELARTIGDLARERIGGLQGIASEPRRAKVTLVGHRWDPACLDVRRFLARNQISVECLEPDDPVLASRWPEAVPGEGNYPALRLADGRILIQPPLREFAQSLGLQTTPSAAEYDTVIVGGGPAGLAAAVYGASEGLRTLVVEREAPGGQAGTSSRIENYLGFPNGISGDELASRALRQATRLGAEILVTRGIVRIDGSTRTLTLDGGDRLRARTIIIATGVSWRHLTVEGFEDLIGKGVYYGAAQSDATVSQGLDVHLIGAGNSAGQAALHFANYARSVTLIVRGTSLEKGMSQYLVDQVRNKDNIRVALQSEVKGVHGDTNLTGIDIVDSKTGAVHHEECGGLFVFIGADAETDWLPPEIARNERGYILTGPDLVKAGRWSESRDPYLVETSVPGIFACGDVRFGPVKRVASAVGEGSMAIAFVHQYLAGQAAQKAAAE